MQDPGTLLAVPHTVERDIVREMGFGVEAPTQLRLDEWTERIEDFTSAHAPFGLPGNRRLNIAAKDEACRTESLETLRRYIRDSEALPNCAVINIHAAPKVWNRPEQVGASSRYGTSPSIAATRRMNGTSHHG